MKEESLYIEEGVWFKATLSLHECARHGHRRGDRRKSVNPLTVSLLPNGRIKRKFPENSVKIAFFQCSIRLDTIKYELNTSV